MIFTTYWFALFALAFFPLYWAARPAGLRLGLLLAGPTSLRRGAARPRPPGKGAPGRALGVAFDRLPLLGWAVTLLFIFVGWLYFFYPVPEATRMLRLLFTP